MDAEKIAAELRERYRNQRGLTARSDYAEVPQRMLMPSVNDPGLYAVKCRVSEGCACLEDFKPICHFLTSCFALAGTRKGSYSNTFTKGDALSQSR